MGMLFASFEDVQVRRFPSIAYLVVYTVITMVENAPVWQLDEKFASLQ